jgi:hypothetical protein
MTISSGFRDGFPIFSLGRLLSFRSAEEEARQLEFARHHELCTAIPFPELNWEDKEDKKRSEQNLVELYVYDADHPKPYSHACATPAVAPILAANNRSIRQCYPRPIATKPQTF